MAYIHNRKIYYYVLYSCTRIYYNIYCFGLLLRRHTTAVNGILPPLCALLWLCCRRNRYYYYYYCLFPSVYGSTRRNTPQLWWCVKGWMNNTTGCRISLYSCYSYKKLSYTIRLTKQYASTSPHLIIPRPTRVLYTSELSHYHILPSSLPISSTTFGTRP